MVLGSLKVMLVAAQPASTQPCYLPYSHPPAASCQLPAATACEVWMLQPVAQSQAPAPAAAIATGLAVDLARSWFYTNGRQRGVNRLRACRSGIGTGEMLEAKVSSQCVVRHANI